MVAHSDVRPEHFRHNQCFSDLIPEQPSERSLSLEVRLTLILFQHGFVNGRSEGDLNNAYVNVTTPTLDDCVEQAR